MGKEGGSGGGRETEILADSRAIYQVRIVLGVTPVAWFRKVTGSSQWNPYTERFVRSLVALNGILTVNVS